MNPIPKPRAGYLLVKASGRLVPPSVSEVEQRWVQEACRHSLSRILWDLTQVTGDEVTGVPLLVRYEIGLTLSETIPVDFRIACLEAPEHLAGARFGESVMLNRGLRVKVTGDRREALAWLGATPPKKNEP